MPRSSASDIVGSAVFVTLPSRAERRRGTQTAMKERQKPSSRLHLRLAVWDGKSGRVGRLRGSPSASALKVVGTVEWILFWSQLDLELEDVDESLRFTLAAGDGRSLALTGSLVSSVATGKAACALSCRLVVDGSIAKHDAGCDKNVMK